MARRFPYLIPALLAVWWPVAMLLFVMFGLFQRNSLLLLTITGLVGIGQGVSWLSPLCALWVFHKVR